MEEFIELVNRPIVIENTTFGTLELRPIFDDDLNFLLKILTRVLMESHYAKDLSLIN